MAASDSNVVIAAFTEDEVQRLTGIRLRQLRYWNRMSFFLPSLIDDEDEDQIGNLYSFRDLVSLKVLNGLRNDNGVSLQHLRKVKEKLATLGEDMWAKTTLYVLKKRVVFHNPESGDLEEVLTGQGVLRIPLEIVKSNMEVAIKHLRTRSSDNYGKIQRKRGVARSNPVIAGTSIQVTSIKAFSDAGYSVKQILREYPGLTERDVEAAIAYDSAA